MASGFTIKIINDQLKALHWGFTMLHKQIPRWVYS
jgi:hypothetical protein